MTKSIFDKVNCYLLTLFSVLYFGQITFFGEGTVYNRLVLLFIYVISIVYFFKVFFNKHYINSTIKIWTVFLVVNTFFFFITGDFEKYNDFNIYKVVILNFLPFYPFYYFAKNKMFTSKVLVLFLVLALPLFIIQFIRSVYTIQIDLEQDEVVSNVIYLFIGLLPFTFYFKKKFLTSSTLLIIWYYMIQSNKRAAIVSGALAILIFSYQIFFVSKYKYKIQTIFLGILVLFGVTYFGFKFYEENEYLQHRMELALSGDSSGRDRIIENHFKEWYFTDSLSTLFFGLGYNSSQKIVGNVAHNDWIDMLASFGLFGLFVYSLLWYHLIKELFTGRWDKNKRIIMILYLGLSFLASLFYRWYCGPFPFMNYMILPYLIASKREQI